VGVDACIERTSRDCGQAGLRQEMPRLEPHRAFGDPMVCQGRCDGTANGEREMRGGNEGGGAPRVRVAAIAAHSSSTVRRTHPMLTVPWGSGQPYRHRTDVPRIAPALIATRRKPRIAESPEP
jgi:hypothetical protein